jgi:hypothetical protein
LFVTNDILERFVQGLRCERECVCYIQAQDRTSTGTTIDEKTQGRRSVVHSFWFSFFSWPTQHAVKAKLQQRKPVGARRVPPLQTCPQIVSGSRPMGRLDSQENDADEKVGQVIFTTYHGSFTSTDAPAYAG